ncbi:MlaD family protein [Patulibacter defluvii]|uniref:MlaD family protein n=1 Tax=Patulibacter defluvii TaxID=3095358 RepID=UPI002A74E295|nr:MlaD family protein [Patulibacter sp. DM4]
MAILGRNRRPKSARARGMNPVAAGALLIVLAVIGLYLGFSKGHVPGSHGYRLNAVVQDAQSIKSGSPVRIAGIAVGKVTAVEPHGDGRTSVVRMDLRGDAPALRQDATLKIRPRIFLEGNFFVDLQPGTPGAAKLAEDSTLPVTRTSSAVQWDQVLSTLPADVRRDLQRTVTGLGDALGEDYGDGTAAAALNRTLLDAPAALRTSAINADALHGTERHDLSRLIAATASVTSSLAPHSRQLTGAIRGLDRTTAALTADQGALRAAIRELAPTLIRADASFDRLNAAFPGTRRLARELLPGVRETGPTIDAALPWVRSARALNARTALRGWVATVRPAVPDLARFVDEGTMLFPQLDAAAQCTSEVVIPAGNAKIEDGRFTTGRETYKGFWYGMVGLAGEGQNGDGNGPYARVQTGLGPNTLDFGNVGNAGQLLGSASRAPIGVRPVRPASRPPYRDDVPCDTQPVPDPNKAKSAPGDAAAVVGQARGAAARDRATSGVDRPTPGIAGGEDRLASELVQRLNPFRGVDGEDGR